MITFEEWKAYDPEFWENHKDIVAQAAWDYQQAKLNIAIEALEFYSGYLPMHNVDGIAKEALEKIR